MMNNMLVKAVVVLLAAAVSAGCRSPRHLAPLVQGAPAQVVTRGDVYLAMSGNSWTGWRDPRKSRHRGKFLPPESSRRKIEMPRKVSLVTVLSPNGREVRKRTLPVSAGEVVLKNLETGLVQAGYRVTVVRKLPAKAELGVDLSLVSADLHQKSGLLSQEGSCDLRVRLDQWQKGLKTKSYNYTSTSFGSSAAGQDLLLASLLAQAAQDIADRALPHLYQ